MVEESLEARNAVVLAGKHVGIVTLCEARSRDWCLQHSSSEPSGWQHSPRIQSAYHVSPVRAGTCHACISQPRLRLVLYIFCR